MIASISYSDLHDASQQAHKVAKRFDDYADELQSKVLNKIGNYNGPWTSNMSDAYNSISTKINELRDDYTRFEAYSTDLDTLRDDCKSVDTAVKSRIATLTAAFKKANKIRNSKIENCLAYTFTALGNLSADGRFNGNMDDYEDLHEEYKDILHDIWLDYEGGRANRKSLIADILKVAGAVLAVAAAVAAVVITGGAAAIIALAATSVLLCMTITDVVIDRKKEKEALELSENNPEDAAMAYRLREINSLSDYLRNGNIQDEYDQTAFNQSYKGRRIWANVWDGTRIVVSVVSIVVSLPSAVTGIQTVAYGIKFGEITNLASTLVGLGISGYEFGFGIASTLSNTIAAIVGDGFQLTDLLNLDFFGNIPTAFDVGTGLYDVHTVDSNSIGRDVIKKLKSNSDIGKMNNIRVVIPKISIPQIMMPTIQVPHIPIMNYGF